MVIFLHGADTFRSHTYLLQQVEKFKKTRDPQGYNVVFLDGKKEEMGKIMQEVLVVPFLAERRLVVIENILSSNNKELLQELISRLKTNQFPESNVIIFWQADALAKIKEVKECKELLMAQKYAQEFPVLEGVVLEKYVQELIEGQGGKIEQAALRYVLQHLGKNGWLLNTTIDQLVAFKKGSTIEIKDVALFINETTEETSFSTLEALMSGDLKRVFKLLYLQRQKGEEDLLGLLIWQVRILLELREFFEKEETVSSDVVAKRLGLHPYVVKKNLVVVKKHSFLELKRMYQLLLDIDIKTKTGFLNQQLLIDVFVSRLAA